MEPASPRHRRGSVCFRVRLGWVGVGDLVGGGEDLEEIVSDMTQEQIRTEFKRQVRLCSGLGCQEMLSLVLEHFEPPKAPKKHDWVFYMNGSFCSRCGVRIGSGTECQ